MEIFPKVNGRVELATSIFFKNLFFKLGKTVEYLDQSKNEF
jgi:hypothetical protein